jgi:hypothetical protein
MVLVGFLACRRECFPLFMGFEPVSLFQILHSVRSDSVVTARPTKAHTSLKVKLLFTLLFCIDELLFNMCWWSVVTVLVVSDVVNILFFCSFIFWLCQMSWIFCSSVPLYFGCVRCREYSSVPLYFGCVRCREYSVLLFLYILSYHDSPLVGSIILVGGNFDPSCMEDFIDPYRVLVGIPTGNKICGRTGNRWG